MNPLNPFLSHLLFLVIFFFITRRQELRILVLVFQFSDFYLKQELPVFLVFGFSIQLASSSFLLDLMTFYLYVFCFSVLCFFFFFMVFVC